MGKGKLSNIWKFISTFWYFDKKLRLQNFKKAQVSLGGWLIIVQFLPDLLMFFRINFPWKHKSFFTCFWERIECYQTAKQLSNIEYCLAIESDDPAEPRNRQNHVHARRFYLTSNFKLRFKDLQAKKVFLCFF